MAPYKSLSNDITNEIIEYPQFFLNHCTKEVMYVCEDKVLVNPKTNVTD